MTLSLSDLILCSEQVDITINGEHFKMPKVVIDAEFVTCNVSGFNDIHEYFTDKKEDPQVIFRELAAYISSKNNGIHPTIDVADDIAADTAEALCMDINISPATSEFICKYLKNTDKLLNYICRTYEQSIARIYPKRYNVFCEDGILTNIKNVFYRRRYYFDETESEYIEEAIQKLFPDLWDRLCRIFNGASRFSLNVIDNRYDACCNLLLKYADDYERVLPEIIEYVATNIGLEILHDIPNVIYQEFWDQETHVKNEIANEFFVKNYRVFTGTCELFYRAAEHLDDPIEKLCVIAHKDNPNIKKEMTVLMNVTEGLLDLYRYTNTTGKHVLFIGHNDRNDRTKRFVSCATGIIVINVSTIEKIMQMTLEEIENIDILY